MPSNRPTNVISLSSSDGLLHLHFPWDAEIKEQVNQLQISDRTWQSPYHVTFNADCIDIVRTIASGAIERNPSWTLIDRTALTNEQIQDKQKLHKAKNEYAAQQAFEDFLRSESCADYTFALVEWGKNWLKLQLNLLLGEETFSLLQKSSLGSGKLLVEDRDNPRLKRGWWFKVASSPQIIALLLAKKTSNISQVSDLTLSAAQPEVFPQVCHCQDESDRAWVGIAIDSVPPKFLNSISSVHNWKLAQIEEDWYWVGETHKLLVELLSDRDRFALEGLADALIHLPLDETLLQLGLVKQCRNYLENLYQSGLRLKCANTNKLLYTSCGYFHPIDFFTTKFHSLPVEIQDNLQQLVNLPLLQWEWEIEKKKNLCAIARVDADRAAAKQLAAPILSAMSKQELLLVGVEHDVTLAKSWSKTKMIDAILGCDRASLICESILELPLVSEKDA